MPENYVTICPYSNDKRNTARDFTEKEWDYILDYLKQINLNGVILNVGNDEIPNDNNLIDLSNKTTLIESIEILKNSNMYIGIDSCLSVIAAQKFDKNKLIVKSQNPHLTRTKHIYYSPKSSFNFIVIKIDEKNII